MSKLYALAEVKAAPSDDPNGEFEVVLSAPTLDRDDEIIDAISLHYRVHESTVIGWLLAMDLEAASARMVAAI